MSYTELARQMVDLHTRYYSEMGQIAHQMTSGGEAITLHLLLTTEGDVFAEDLARRTGLSAGRVASILRKFEDRQLIVRTRDDSNRRKYRIELTSAGQEVARREERHLLESHEELLRELGEEDSRDFLRILSRLCTIFQEHSED